MTINEFKSHHLYLRKKELIKQGLAIVILTIPVLISSYSVGIYYYNQALLKQYMLQQQKEQEERSKAQKEETAAETKETIETERETETETETETEASIYTYDVGLGYSTITMDELHMFSSETADLDQLMNWPDGYNAYSHGDSSFICPRTFFQTANYKSSGLYNYFEAEAADGTVLKVFTEEDTTKYVAQRRKDFLREQGEKLSDYEILVDEADEETGGYLEISGHDAENPNLVVRIFYRTYAGKLYSAYLKIAYPEPADEEEAQKREYFVQMVYRSIPFCESDRELCSFEEFLNE